MCKLWHFFIFFFFSNPIHTHTLNTDADIQTCLLICVHVRRRVYHTYVTVYLCVCACVHNLEMCAYMFINIRVYLYIWIIAKNFWNESSRVFRKFVFLYIYIYIYIYIYNTPPSSILNLSVECGRSLSKGSQFPVCDHGKYNLPTKQKKLYNSYYLESHWLGH